MKLKFSDIIIVAAILLNLSLLAYTRYAAVSQAQLNTIATTINHQSFSQQLLQGGSLIASLLLTGMILAYGTSLYLHIRDTKQAWVLRNYAFMFFAVLLILDLMALGLGVPF